MSDLFELSCYYCSIVIFSPGPGKELELPPIEPLLKVKKKRAKKVSSQPSSGGSSSTAAAAVGAGGEKLHVCTECPYTCNRADKLKVHVKGVHNNDKPFLCTFCFKGLEIEKLTCFENCGNFMKIMDFPFWRPSEALQKAFRGPERRLRLDLFRANQGFPDAIN